MIEIWKDIKGYEGLYQISNLGQVKSLNYKHTHKIKLLKPIIDTYGYYYIGLYKNGFKQLFKIHRLVAETFLVNQNNYPIINHKDCNPLNNCVWVNEDGSIDKEKSNLEWCTYKYNNNYADANKKRSNSLKKPIKQMALDGTLIAIWSGIKDTENSGFIRADIIQCCQGKRKTHNGFKWEYLN